MNSITRFILLGSIFLMSGCIYDPPRDISDHRFIISNRSKGTIYCYASLDTSINELESFGASEHNNNESLLFPIEEISPDSSASITGVTDWNGFINANSKDSTICIFIFDKKDVDKKGWGQIVVENAYLRRYQLNEEKLNEMNWHIAYR